MANLAPRNRFFQDLFDFRRDFDQIFNQVLSLPGEQWSAGQQQAGVASFMPAIETSVDKDRKNYRIQVSLPGVDPKEVNIHVQGNTITLSGERKSTRENKEGDYLQREIVYGSFQRTIELPDGVDADKINAEYRNGMLEITAPISASAQPRKIEIKSAPSSRQVSAGSSS